MKKYDQNEVKEYINELEFTILRELINVAELCFDPNDDKTLIENDIDFINKYKQFEDLLDECGGEIDNDNKEQSKWVIRLTLNRNIMLDKNITMEDINYAISNAYNNVSCVYSDYNSDNLIFRIRLNKNSQNKKKKGKPNIDTLDQSDEIYILKNLLDDIMDNLIIRGIKNIKKVLLRKITDNFEEFDTKYMKKEIWVLDTVGSNLLDLLSLDFVDTENTVTNDIIEIYNVLGIEAARQAIFDEFSDVIEFDSTYINYHHLSILADRMTCNDKMVSIFRHGINNDDIGPIAKASFEETPEMFLKAARHAELDIMKGVSANIMCGQQGYYGTNAFKVLTDIELISKTLSDKKHKKDEEYTIEEELKQKDDDFCNISNIEIQSAIDSIKKVNIGHSNNYILDF